MDNLDERVSKAMRQFWLTRERQRKRAANLDKGFRASVTGGKHLDGFIDLCYQLLREAGLPDVSIHYQKRLELPGYFRAEKCWDLLVVVDGHLLAVMEFKAQVGPSFGNNFNNRTEEVLGNATDLWAAYREGAFAPSLRPWLGFLFILEECEKSLRNIKVQEPHFPVFAEFQNSSYAKRYEVLLTKLVRERLYDAACFLMSDPKKGKKGEFRVPSEELSFRAFASSLMGHAIAFAKTR